MPKDRSVDDVTSPEKTVTSSQGSVDPMYSWCSSLGSFSSHCTELFCEKQRLQLLVRARSICNGEYLNSVEWITPATTEDDTGGVTRDADGSLSDGQDASPSNKSATASLRTCRVSRVAADLLALVESTLDRACHLAEEGPPLATEDPATAVSK